MRKTLCPLSVLLLPFVVVLLREFLSFQKNKTSLLFFFPPALKMNEDVPGNSISEMEKVGVKMAISFHSLTQSEIDQSLNINGRWQGPTWGYTRNAKTNDRNFDQSGFGIRIEFGIIDEGSAHFFFPRQEGLQGKIYSHRRNLVDLTSYKNISFSGNISKCLM